MKISFNFELAPKVVVPGTKKMYLFGASGHAKVIVDILRKKSIKVEGFFDDDLSKIELEGIPVIGITEDHTGEQNPCLISIGNNNIRKAVVERLCTAIYATALHPNAVISNPELIGQGTVVMAGVVINPSTRIGAHCIINTSASIDHDCLIDNFVHIAPNATLCGGIEIGEGTLVGSGTTIIPNTKVGKWAVIGAGTVVITDVPDYAVVVGNPGKVIKIEKPV